MLTSWLIFLFLLQLLTTTTSRDRNLLELFTWQRTCFLLSKLCDVKLKLQKSGSRPLISKALERYSAFISPVPSYWFKDRPPPREPTGTAVAVESRLLTGRSSSSTLGRSSDKVHLKTQSLAQYTHSRSYHEVCSSPNLWIKSSMWWRTYC